MPKFVIEREIAGIGGSSELELQAISAKSCGVLAELGPDVQWTHSYVTADKLYCVYSAASEDLGPRARPPRRLSRRQRRARGHPDRSNDRRGVATAQ